MKVVLLCVEDLRLGGTANALESDPGGSRGSPRKQESMSSEHRLPLCKGREWCPQAYYELDRDMENRQAPLGNERLRMVTMDPEAQYRCTEATQIPRHGLPRF